MKLACYSVISSEIQFMTSGNGSKAWKGDVNERDSLEMKFYYDGQGLMSDIYRNQNYSSFLRWLWARFASLERLL